MEYPFKDLLPLDEVLAREGYYKDWTHLDPEVFYSLTQISNFIKTKGYGVDVRLLIAQLAEHFGLKTTQVVDLANLLSTKHDALKGQFDVVIRDATSGADWGGEIVLARGGKPTLQARLDDTTAQLAQKRDLSVKLKGTDLDTSANANKVQLINLSSDVQAAMAGTAPVIGTVTDGSLTTEKYADGSVARTKLNIPSVFDYETTFKYPTSKITMNNCTVAYSDRELVVTPTDATKWWGFGVSADIFVADVANFGSQLIISESTSHYLAIALTGGNAGYFYKLSKTDTNFETGAYQDRLTLDLTGYTHIMAVRHNATTLKLYKYNGAWELVATVDISKYFSSGFASAGIVFGTSKNTTPVLNALFYIPDRNVTNAIKGLVDSLQTQITSLSTQADTLNYPWAGETAYFIGDSITDFDLYQPYLKDHLKLAGYNNFTQSGAPLCNVVDRTHLLTKTDDMLAYLTATGKSPKLVVIWGGTNDFGLNCPLGTIASGTTYTLGALRRIIDKINTAHPKCTIIGVTPMQRNATGGTDLAGMGPNTQGLYLKDYSDGIKSVFEANGVPVIDMYKNSGINVYNVNNTDILRDGLHPADIFNPRIAFMFANFISNYTKIV